MAKLRITATVEVELPSDRDELRRQYLADSYVQATANQMKWIEDCEVDFNTLLDHDTLTVNVDLVI